ncbi:MAG: porin family protein [Deltaproteobacteria bacterium]|nr:porin family protein [Deltaproteobacteria bacterium]
MRVWLTAVALSCAMIGASAAADLGARTLPTKGPTFFTPAPAFTWSGLYVGVSGGYGWGNARFDSAIDGTGSTFRTRGGIASGTLGYNMQAGAIVYGLETDLGPSWIKGTNSAAVPCANCEVTNTWLGTFRGRVGYAPGVTLFYLTGGLAYGGIRVKDAFGEEDRNKAGWTLGGGAEYAFANRWSAKLEYLYVDLGTTDLSAGRNLRFNENILRAGLNARF